MNKKINVISATDARKGWSQLIDSAVHEKPQIISRTRDHVLLTDLNLFSDILEAYQFTADKYIENDNSVTLSLNEIDLVTNGSTEKEARIKLADEILEYSDEYYNDFQYWSKIPNRKRHISYVLKALILQDANKIGDSILCLPGKN